MDTNLPLAQLVHKFAARAPLDDSDCAAILDLPYVPRTYKIAAYLVREGDTSKRQCSLLISGFAFRQKSTADGLRQIVSLHMPGDLLDLSHLFLGRADHSVQALTRVETAEIDLAALRALALSRPAVSQAMLVDTLIDAAMLRERMTMLGRYDARARVAHLLCEFAARMDAIGLSDGKDYELPMTQDQMGDVTGLTGVHVNRTLRSLIADGLISRDGNITNFPNLDALREIAGFNSRYLHLDALLISK